MQNNKDEFGRSYFFDGLTPLANALKAQLPANVDPVLRYGTGDSHRQRKMEAEAKRQRKKAKRLKEQR